MLFNDIDKSFNSHKSSLAITERNLSESHMKHPKVIWLTDTFSRLCAFTYSFHVVICRKNCLFFPFCLTFFCRHYHWAASYPVYVESSLPQSVIRFLARNCKDTPKIALNHWRCTSPWNIIYRFFSRTAILTGDRWTWAYIKSSIFSRWVRWRIDKTDSEIFAPYIIKVYFVEQLIEIYAIMSAMRHSKYD